MKRVALCIFSWILLSAPAAFAQELPEGGHRVAFDPFLQEDSSERRPRAGADRDSGYATRQELVFRKAALRAAQRQQRIARNKWLGYSPLRPPVSTVPAMGSPVGRPRVVWSYPGTLYPLRVAY